MSTDASRVDGALVDAAPAGDAMPGDTTPPEVTFTNPSAGAFDVSTLSAVSVAFNETIDAASLNATSFTLRDDLGNSVEGVVTTSPTGGTFAPHTALSFDRIYTARLSGMVTDVTGNRLASDYVWSFATAHPSWGAAISIDTTTESARGVRLAADGSGHAIAAWQQYDGAVYNIWVSRYTAGFGWTPPQSIEANPGNATRLEIAMNPSGDAIVLWTVSGGSPAGLWVNRFRPGVGWSPAEKIAPGGDHIVGAISPSGAAIVVWEQGNTDISAARYTPGVGWLTPELVDASDESTHDPRVGFDSQGNAIIVWAQGQSIWARRYEAASGWDTATLIETNSSQGYSPKIALDGAGNAIATWRQNDNTGSSRIWANRYEPGLGWGTAEIIETLNADASMPELAMNERGDAVVVWTSVAGSTVGGGSTWHVWANRYVAGAGWQGAEMIEANDAVNGRKPRVGIDSNGNAVAVWYFQPEQFTHNVWANRYSSATGWGTPELIESHSGRALDPHIAVDRGGNAVSVWDQTDDGATYNVWANEFR